MCVALSVEKGARRPPLPAAGAVRRRPSSAAGRRRAGMIGRLVLLGALAIEGAQGFALVSVPAATNLRARPAASTARGSAFSVRMSGAPGGDK